MRVDLVELLEKLGVNRELYPYEAQPWFLYDEEQGITCSAEVRMGPGAEDLEAEIQFLYDEEQEEEKVTPGANEEEDHIEIIHYFRKQILHMRALPVVQGQWTPVDLRINDENYVNKIYDWEGKGCNFFLACIEAIQMGELPNIEELTGKELKDDAKGSGKRGRIGRKSPKANPAALMGMKK